MTLSICLFVGISVAKTATTFCAARHALGRFELLFFRVANTTLANVGIESKASKLQFDTEEPRECRQKGFFDMLKSIKVTKSRPHKNALCWWPLQNRAEEPSTPDRVTVFTEQTPYLQLEAPNSSACLLCERWIAFNLASKS